MTSQMFKPTPLPFGGLSSSSTPKITARPGARGLLVRGVVLGVRYVDDNNPTTSPADASLSGVPSQGSMLVDVLAYTSIPGAPRFARLPPAIIAQGGGVHDGETWVPRPCRRTLDGTPITDFDSLAGTDPAKLDGDHVLVAFMDHTAQLPVIIGCVPHPAQDAGSSGLPANARLGPRSDDFSRGDRTTRFVRHNGVAFGVDDQGNFVLDATRGHDGTLGLGGAEIPPVSIENGSGSITLRLKRGATFKVDVVSDPVNPDPDAPAVLHTTIELTDDPATGLLLRVGSRSGEGLTLTGADGQAALVIGLEAGAMRAAIAEHLESLWSAFKASMDAYIAGHLHEQGTAATGGPTGPPAALGPQGSIPDWSSVPQIAADKLKLQDNGP